MSRRPPLLRHLSEAVLESDLKWQSLQHAMRRTQDQVMDLKAEQLATQLQHATRPVPTLGGPAVGWYSTDAGPMPLPEPPALSQSPPVPIQEEEGEATERISDMYGRPPRRVARPPRRPLTTRARSVGTGSRPPNLLFY